MRPQRQVAPLLRQEAVAVAVGVTVALEPLLQGRAEDQAKHHVRGGVEPILRASTANSLADTLHPRVQPAT